MNRILLVEDDELVGTMVSLNLKSEGYTVTWCQDGAKGLASALSQPYDLLLLDISLPEKSGLEVLRGVREASIGTPVLMLTARSDVESKVEALNLGADDYLPKPFHVDEMVARVRAQMRRAQAEREHPSSQVLSIGAHRVDMASREASSQEGPVTLSEKEVAILALLIRADGKPLTRADIIEEVWGMENFPVDRTVDNYILRLRKLFEPDPATPRHLLTVRGAGFRFTP